ALRRRSRELWSRSLRRRELERELRTFTLRRLDPDPTAHRRHELLGDEQSEPGSAAAVSNGRFGSVELAEDPVLLERRDADAFVDDTNLDGSLAPTRADRDRPSVRRVLECVVDQDVEH